MPVQTKHGQRRWIVQPRMWAWSHRTRFCRPAGFAAALIGGGRPPKQVKDQSGIRDRHRAGVAVDVDLLAAGLGRSFEHAAKLVCRQTAKKPSRIAARESGALPRRPLVVGARRRWSVAQEDDSVKLPLTTDSSISSLIL